MLAPTAADVGIAPSLDHPFVWRYAFPNITATTVPSDVSVSISRQYSLAYPGGSGNSENARSMSQ